jgi:histidinol-phosphate/aromatic aminotransferase/cobyric acid decarboxylase-like protein
MKHEGKFVPDWENLNAPPRSIVFICTPCNPTGQLVDKNKVTAFAGKHRDTLVLVDESFIDFCEGNDKKSLIGPTPLPENILVVKSLTKFFFHCRAPRRICVWA